jgi:ArsR family transcriptional regulator
LTFRAFADRTRRRILHLLQDGEFCVGNIAEILQVPQPKASRHLIYLGKAGLVMTRKQGLWSFYELRPPQTAFHQKLLECLGQCFKDVPGIAADTERAAKLMQSTRCCPQ